MATSIPVLFDTDIGSDIDDAVALAYLLKQPACDLLGITTVTGDVQKRAALAEMVCRAAGKEHIPIHCGKRDVLLFGPGQPNVPQYEPVKHMPHRMDRPENTAVEFLRKSIRARPHEITLLTVGPYSNVAVLFSLDPEIPLLLRGLVSMAGRFFSDPFREWNVDCDPYASAIVYASKRREHVSIGLDVTLKCTMKAVDVRSKFTTGPLVVVAKMAEAWFEQTDQVTFHDPLAATTVFHPGLCGYRKGAVTVSTGSPESFGQTLFQVKEEGADQVASDVDVNAFFTEYFSVF